MTFIQRSITLYNRLLLNVVEIRATIYMKQKKRIIGIVVTYSKHFNVLNIFISCLILLNSIGNNKRKRSKQLTIVYI